MNFQQIFNSQAKSVTFAAFLVAISSGISSILGLIRDGLLAGRFGVWEETNAYFAAFRINDFFYNLFVVGGLAVAFLPLFTEYYTKAKETAWEMTNYVLNFFLFLLIFSALLIFLFSPQLVKIITPGFTLQEQIQTSRLIRIMILSPILFGLSAVFSGILHYFNRFLVYAISPVLYNLGIIFGILFLSPVFGISGVAMGVIMGAVFYWLVQIPAVLYCGFRYRPLFDFRYPAVKRIFLLTVPRLFAMGASQINLLFITAIASTISGGIAIFTFANNLQYFPISLVAIPFAVASFPLLSKNWAHNEKTDFRENFSLIFRQILFLMVPLATLFFLLRAQIVRLVLGSFGGNGRFDWAATQLTAASLGLFSFGILAFAFILYLSRAFFSFQDTKTPTVAALFSVLFNVFSALSLVWLFGNSHFFQIFFTNLLKLQGVGDIKILALPLAFSLSAIFQCFLLLFFLYRKIGGFGGQKILPSFFKILFLSSGAGAAAFLGLRFMDFFIDTEKVWGLFFQTLFSALLGLSVYLFFAFLFQSLELRIIFSSFKKQALPREKIVPAEIEIQEM